jgi:hypothetical protein
MPRSLWVCACFVAACFSVTSTATAAGEQARISISDLKPLYCNDEQLSVTIWNRGERAIAINVAIETFVDGKWLETWASLKTPPDEIHSKSAATDLVEPGKSVAYSFDIFKFPIRADLAQARWRLRADAILPTGQASFASSEFAICAH